jgi:hypothetical protein
LEAGGGALGGAVLSKVLPLLSTGLGKITPQALKDLGGGISKAVSPIANKVGEIAKNTEILPKGISNAINTGAKKLQTLPGNIISSQYPSDTVQIRSNAFKSLSDRLVGAGDAVEAGTKKGFDVIGDLAKDDRFIPEVSKDGNVDSTLAMKNLDDFIKPMAQAERQAIESQDKLVPLDDFKQEALKQIEKYKGRGAAYENMKARIESDFNSYAKTYGVDINGNPIGSIPQTSAGNKILSENPQIKLSQLDDIKNSKYGISNWDNEDSQIADKTVARAAKETVYNNLDAKDIQALNKEMSRYYSAKDFLEAINNKKVNGGKLGKYFARTLGAVVGSHAGPLGAVVGSQVGEGVESSIMKNTFPSGRNPLITPYPEALYNATKNMKR